MYNEDESFEWDQAKALANSRKHRVQFTEARDVLYDEMAITMRDDASRRSKNAT